MENDTRETNSFLDRVKNDLKESRINWKVVLLMIPVAFLTYLFHEFGHWNVGELLGNEMILSLNNAAPLTGDYIHKTDSLYVLMGGPAFTILQAIIFLLVIEKTKSVYAYTAVFYAGFIRFFSIFFGGFNLQDEAKISAILNIGFYTVAAIVLLILSLIIWKSSYLLKLKLKAIGYFTVLGVISSLLVIGMDKLIK